MLRIVAQVRIGADGVARFYDPNYGLSIVSPIGATGTINPSTGAATLTFNPGEVASGLTVFYRYPNDVIAIDNGTGTIVGIPGVSGTINYTTGAYSITLPASEAMTNSQNSGITYGSSSIYKHQFGGPSYSGFELKWKSGVPATVTTDHAFPIQREYYGGNGRAGVGGSQGAFNFANGTPTFDITNGLKKAYYNVAVAANTQVNVPAGEASIHTGIVKVYINDVTFNNIGGGTNKYLLDTLRVTSAGAVEAFVAGSWAAAGVIDVITSQAVATLSNGVPYTIEISITGAGITVSQVLGRTGETSLFFNSQPYFNDINLEMFGTTDLTTPNLQSYNIQFI